MVGAGGDQVHAVDLDAQAVVGQAVDGRQAGNAAGTVETDTGNVPQQAGGIAGGRAHLLDAARAGSTILVRIMADTIHWADVIAEDVLQNEGKHLVATGITPSGHIHIGNMREVVTADAVYQALLDKGSDADFIYIADNYDPLRKVYPFLPESYADHVGKPISEVPCPCGDCANYADHFLQPFLEALRRLGISPKVYRADEMYREGRYTEAIKTALVKRDAIAKILEEVSGKTIEDDWSPFNPRCNGCGKITTTKVKGFDLEAETVDYACACGHMGTVPMAGGGNLPGALTGLPAGRFSG